MRWHIWSMPVAVLLVLSGSIRADEPAPPAEEPIYQGKTLTEWIADFKDPKKATQRAAVHSLAVFGPKKEVVSALTTALKSEDVEVVVPAAGALGKFGFKAKEALPELRAAYKRLSAGPPPLTGDKKYSTEYLKMFADAHRAVAEALLLIDDHPGVELAPILLEALKTGDAEKRRDIVIKLGKLGPAAAQTTVPALIGVLKDTEEAARQASPPVIPASLHSSGNSSNSREREIRLEAVKSLGRIGPAAKPALHALTMAMKLAAPEKEARVEQMEGWDKPIGSADAKKVVMSFTTVTGDKAMLRACADALGRIRPQAKGTMGALRLALRDLDEGVRWAALCALLESGQDAKEVVPILLNYARHKDAAFRRVAIQALGKSGSEAKRIVPVLTAVLKDKDASLRASAAEAMGEVGPKAKMAVPALIGALKDTEAKVRESAAEALGKIGAADEKVISALLAALQDKEDSVIRAVVLAFIQFGAKAKSAIPSLLDLIRSADRKQRAGACVLLGSIGPAAKEAIPTLEKQAQEDSEVIVRLFAHTALAQIDPSRLTAVVRRLIAEVQGKNEEVRLAAAECLGFLGPDARDALSTLRELRERSNDIALNFALVDAIEKIEKPKESSEER
jgi:HEAT repeat protein